VFNPLVLEEMIFYNQEFGPKGNKVSQLGHQFLYIGIKRNTYIDTTPNLNHLGIRYTLIKISIIQLFQKYILFNFFLFYIFFPLCVCF